MIERLQLASSLFFENITDKKVFILLFSFGAVLIVILRSITPDPIYGALFACLVCIMFLTLLASFIFYQQKHGVTSKPNPDNVYYLGLLFTLISLVYSLVTLFLLPNGEIVDIDKRTYNLIGSFGIALISTIFGIFYRILLLQMDSTDDQTDMVKLGNLKRTALKEIIETAFKLRMELTQTIADMSVFRKAIRQATNETVKEANETRELMTKDVTESHKKVLGYVDKAGKVITSKTDNILVDLNKHVLHAQKLLDEVFSEQTQKFKHLTNLFDTKSDTLVEKVENSSEKITEGTNNIAHTLESTATLLQQITKYLESAGSNADKLSTTFDSVTSSLVLTTRELSEHMVKADQVISPQYKNSFEQVIKLLETDKHYQETLLENVEIIKESINKLNKKTMSRNNYLNET